MGMSPSANIFFGYVISNFDEDPFAPEDGSYFEVEDISTDLLSIERCGFECADALVCIPNTHFYACDWGEYDFSEVVREVSDEEARALFAEAMRLGLPLPKKKPSWVCVTNYS